MKMSYSIRWSESRWKFVYPLAVCAFLIVFYQRADAQSVSRLERYLIASFQFDTTPDTDRDGLSDGKESFQYGTSAILADSDRDGESDLSEILRGDNPLDLFTPTVNRVLHLVASLKFDTTPDTDMDGLSDGDESFQYGTSATLADSDQDGESDLSEILKGGNPLDIFIPTVNRVLHLVASLKVDTTSDYDKDGLTDGVESEVTGTEFQIPDTDFDGVSDLDELLGLGNRNPFELPVRKITAQRMLLAGGFLIDTTPDADKDGLTDGYELNVSMTDPFLKDTDQDNINDGMEVLMGTNPLDIVIISPPSSLVFGIQGISDESITLFFTGTGNPVIQLYGSQDLNNWELIETIVVEGEESSYSNQIKIPLDFDVEFFQAIMTE